MSNFETGSIVRTPDGTEGVVTWNPFGDIFLDEIQIATGNSLGVDLIVRPEELEVIGAYSPEIIDPRECGLGTANPCNYIAIGGPDDFQCTRFSELGFELATRAKQRGQLLPVGIYPQCQEDIKDAASDRPNERVLEANRVEKSDSEREPDIIRMNKLGEHVVNSVPYGLYAPGPPTLTSEEMQGMYDNYIGHLKGLLESTTPDFNLDPLDSDIDVDSLQRSLRRLDWVIRGE